MNKKRNYTAWGLSLGAGLGAAVGVMWGNMGVWLAVGVAIGVALGASLRGKGANPDCPECAQIHRAHEMGNPRQQARS